MVIKVVRIKTDVVMRTFLRRMYNVFNEANTVRTNG